MSIICLTLLNNRVKIILSAQLADNKLTKVINMNNRDNFKFVVDLAANPKLVNSVKHGFEGRSLKYENYAEPGALKVSKLYQRLLSVHAVKKYNKLNLKLLVPAVVARRPKSLGKNGGDWLIDGQHKAVLYFLSGARKENVDFPVMIFEHDEDATLEECEKHEAEIFYALNTQRKKLSKIDEIRAGVVFDEPVSIWVERMLKKFNIQADGFGSAEDDAKELKSFNQFFIAVTSDYKMEDPDAEDYLTAGYELWFDMFKDAKENYMTGPMYRACCLLAHFLNHVLENGQQKLLYDYLTKLLPLVETQTTLTKGFIDANAHRYIFFNIMDKYMHTKDYKAAGPRHQIGEATWDAAIKVSRRFKRPDAEVVVS